MTRIETVDPNWIEIFRMTAIGLFEIETLRVQDIWICKIKPKRLEKLNF
jgi:hypothetical protein